MFEYLAGKQESQELDRSCWPDPQPGGEVPARGVQDSTKGEGLNRFNVLDPDLPSISEGLDYCCRAIFNPIFS